jgi:choline dehydrogenase-like flavoprotein
MITGRTTYNITSEPCPELKGRRFPVVVGCVVGGSSAINGQVFQKGTAEEYDAWGALSGVGDPKWNWNSMIPYFRKVRDTCDKHGLIPCASIADPLLRQRTSRRLV